MFRTHRVRDALGLQSDVYLCLALRYHSNANWAAHGSQESLALPEQAPRLVSCHCSAVFDPRKFLESFRNRIRVRDAIELHSDVYLFRLSGTIPTQVGLLTDLENLWFDYNEFQGQYLAPAAPFSIRGNFSESFRNRIIRVRDALGLHSDVYLFRLSGTIPTQSGLLTGLTKLDLSGNELQGQHFASAALFSKLATKKNAKYFEPG